ncbi:hypothetical protein [Streptomyces halobius]|uniref:Uncharacterized protein n=1 Tax=Streptomyces halobius TaxID=2879846 RepID=A0ABY4MAK4_9ACTN|nr:hypothetical protein [Streptomyces halobius]UQA93824.1 hypothetical protein K9S39_19870 [Streptomyces halobius]
MSAPMIRTPHQAVRDVRQRLDDALDLVGLDAGPSVITQNMVEGIVTNRIRLATLSIPRAISLVQAIGGRVPGTLAREVAKALDAALHTAGIDTETPSAVLWNTWTATRIIPPSMDHAQSELLVKTIREAAMSGTTDDLSKKNRDKNKESSGGSDSGKNTGRKW